MIIKSRASLVIILLICFTVSGCGVFNKTITIKTEIQNAESMRDYGLNLENGGSKLIFVPNEKFLDWAVHVATLPNGERIVFSGYLDENYEFVPYEDKYVSIPLTKTINTEVKLKPETSYFLVVNTFSVSKDYTNEISPLILLTMSDSDNKVYPYWVDTYERDGDLVFDKEQLLLDFWYVWGNQTD